MDAAQAMSEIAGRHVRGDHSTCNPKICPHLKIRVGLPLPSIDLPPLPESLAMLSLLLKVKCHIYFLGSEITRVSQENIALRAEVVALREKLKAKGIEENG